MLRSNRAIQVVLIILAGLGATASTAQDYPTRPVRIVTSPPGGGNDFVARMIAQEISAPLGQQVIVDNRPGGVIPGEIVSKAPPNGYTLLAAGGTFTIGPLFQKTPYDVLKDFITVVVVGMAPNIVVVHPQVPVKSVKELIALAKAKPGQLNYSSAPVGAQTHLAGELFKSMAGVNIVRVVFKGNGPAVASAISGEVQVMFPNPPTAMTHIKSGRLRALAVTSTQPSALVPGVPTVAASGVPGYEVISMDFIFAPADTPAPIINRLNQEMVRALNRPEVKQKFFDTGVEVVGSSLQESVRRMTEDVAKWEKLIKRGSMDTN